MAKDPVCGMMVDEKKSKIQIRLQRQNILFLRRLLQNHFRQRPSKIR
ncbi:MAG: YHS domain-containing protein [Candidatus Bathyarchaeia archaeon]